MTSPFPTEAFDHATWDAYGGSFDKPLRIRGPDAIEYGEYTMVFLREPDLGRLRYGLVTRDPEGQFEVCDPTAIADAVGNHAARLAWEKGIGKLPAWTEKKEERRTKYQNIALIDVNAVEIVCTAAQELASRENEIHGKICDMGRKMEECEVKSAFPNRD